MLSDLSLASVAIGTVPAVAYRESSVGINLILGGDAKSRVAIPGGPGQVDSSLELVVHLLVNGASKLSAVISAGHREQTVRKL